MSGCVADVFYHTARPRLFFARSEKKQLEIDIFVKQTDFFSVLMIKGDFHVYPVKAMNTPPSFQTYENGLIPAAILAVKNYSPLLIQQHRVSE